MEKRVQKESIDYIVYLSMSVCVFSWIIRDTSNKEKASSLFYLVWDEQDASTFAEVQFDHEYD